MKINDTKILKGMQGYRKAELDIHKSAGHEEKLKKGGISTKDTIEITAKGKKSAQLLLEAKKAEITASLQVDTSPEKLQALKDMVQSGQYQVDLSALAGKILD